MNANELKNAIKALGVVDRMRVCTHGATLHIYLSKAVRQNADLLGRITALVEETTGRRSITAPGSFARYTVVPTFEAQS
jgi:DNA-binding transcriptional LysR family regulator